MTSIVGVFNAAGPGIDPRHRQPRYDRQHREAFETFRQHRHSHSIRRRFSSVEERGMGVES